MSKILSNLKTTLKWTLAVNTRLAPIDMMRNLKQTKMISSENYF